MNKISTVIVGHDSPSHIFESLQSVKDLSSEIIVVDIGLDKVLRQQIEKESKVKIVKIERKIAYVELIREEVKKYAVNEYILFLDPDEVFSSGLIAYLMKMESDSYDYLLIPRKNIIFGKWMQYSRWWPDYQIRLFRKNKVVWPKQIHQPPQPTGKGFTIEAKEPLAVVHFNYENIDQYLEKMKRYAKAEAEERLTTKENFTLNQTIKLATAEFISRFFAGEGYKDGMHGFVLATLQMSYYFFVYFYFWERKKYFPVERQELIQGSYSYFKNGLKEANYWISKNKPFQLWKKIKSILINRLIN